MPEGPIASGYEVRTAMLRRSAAGPVSCLNGRLELTRGFLKHPPARSGTSSGIDA
jgi:hypothetical protein